MASPPLLARVRTSVTTRRAVIGAIAAAASVGLVAAWMIPTSATADSGGTSTAIPVGMPQRSLGGTADDSSAAEKAPVAASRTTKARHVPAFPRDAAHHGKRIVYDKALMTVWLVDKDDTVVARLPVVGRFDRPAKGTYRVFSKSTKAWNPNSKVTFNWMARFTYGPDTRSAIGFHAIPRYYDGTPMHATDQLGLAIARGGCVRLSERAAKQVYEFLKVGDLVVVLPSP
jgi:lipoprotein-anchoring transpeptidase ErfK/SrfK